MVEAELLLHVVDASSPAAAEHTAHVIETLSQIGAWDQTSQVLVLNKMDLIPGELDAAGWRGAFWKIRSISAGRRGGLRAQRRRRGRAVQED